MKKLFTAVICLLLSALMVFGACGKKPDKEYTLELEDGCRQLTIYYNREAGYEDCDVWLWYGSVVGRGYKFHNCAYGGKVVVNVPDTTETVGFIIRTNCSAPGGEEWGSANKDGTDSDRTVTLSGDYTEIYTKAGDPNNYTSTDGGKTLEIMRFISIADMLDKTHVKVTSSDSAAISKDTVKITDADGKNVAITAEAAGNVYTLGEELDLSKAYTVKIEGFDEVSVVPMTYFSSAAFEREYTYDGELGVILTENETTFRLWAPTASKVVLNLYDIGYLGKPVETIPMTRGEKGVWSYTRNANLAGKYYTYTVTTSAGENEAVDPYARSAGLNGGRGMIVDLDSTDPKGWTDTPFDSGIENYTDAQIWEVHIRDFSNRITASKYKGKYLAFTETGLKNASGVPVGVDYLKELGITHVHLLPSFDYASVDESKNDGFNWGYDPLNYNVPEGSYSTDPADGAVRVNEYKQMVQALHEQGIGVVMDVVYNHTYSADSNFSKIVPYYYYRYNGDGTLSSGSGCGNDTASDRSMFRKFMIDSVTYWQEEYNLDGFRFDLMGLHDLKTMQEIEKAVHAKNPSALIYGEGWTGGTSMLDENDSAVLANLIKLNNGTSTKGVNGIAMFNDVLRDGAKGSVFDINDTGFATGAKDSYLDRVLFGVTGCYNNPEFTEYEGASWFAANPTQVINYVSAHDNNTLWDRICHAYGEEGATLQMRLKRNALSAAIVQTSLGVPFMQAGEEMLRSKKNADGSYNENSYNASDAVNNIDWDALKTGSSEYKMMQYYKGLIEFRKSCDTLRLPYAADDVKRKYVCEAVKKDGAFVAFTVTDTDTNEKLLIIYNAKETDYDFTLPSGGWDLYVNGESAGARALQTGVSGAQKIAAVSCYVYKSAVKA